MTHDLRRYYAAAVVDGDGCCAAPGSLLVAFERQQATHIPCARVIAVGSTTDVDRHPDAAQATVIERAHDVLVPGFVNAHTHLDLTHIGPQPHDPGDGFVTWVNMVRAQRETGDEAIRASVRAGIDLLRAGATVAVGDIAGAPDGVPSRVPGDTLAGSGLWGVSFIEFFAIGPEERERGRIEGVLAFMERLLDEPDDPCVRFGLQPHAPNTVGFESLRRAFSFAQDRAIPSCIHVGETPEEREFIALGTGPQRALLESLGAWDDRILDHVGSGRTPVEHVVRAVEANSRPTLVHLNHVTDEDLDRLAGFRCVYCPRASAYFGAEDHFGPHRYRDMLQRGIPVALGTDSIVNLPASAAIRHSGGMSILDEMRFLFRRDRTDPVTLLRMGTLHGAGVLGLDSDWARFRAGSPVLGVAAIPLEGAPRGPAAEVLEQVLLGRGPASLLFGGIDSCQTENGD